MGIDFDLEACSLFFLAMMAVSFTARWHLNDKREKLFLLMIIDVAINIITHITFVHFVDGTLPFNYVLFMGYNTIYSISVFTFPVLLVRYLNHVSNPIRTPLSQKMLKCADVLAVLTALLYVILIHTGLIYIIDGENIAETGIGNIITAVFYFVILAFFIPIVIFHNRKFDKIQIYDVSGILLICIIAYLVKLANPQYIVQGTVFVLSLTLIYMLHENPIKYTDRISGCNNRFAYELECIKRKTKDKNFNIYIIEVDNFSVINSAFGTEGGNVFLSAFGYELIKRFGGKNVFRYGGDAFVVLLDGSREYTEIWGKISQLFEKEWEIKNVTFTITTYVGCVASKDFSLKGDNARNLKLADRVVETARRELRKNSDNRNRCIFFDESFERKMEREEAIKLALNHAIASGSIEMNYQPIFCTASKSFESMEALTRLYVEGYGYISPEEFITMAERDGLIVKLGYIILEEVCKFVSENKLLEKGIKFVEVNMSAIQGFEESFADRVVEILNKYHIPMAALNLELTESVALHSEQRLKENMRKLNNLGVTFALDDFGSGYSNVSYIVDMPFSIVKLDKYLVWSAFNAEKSKKILEYNILMFKNIKLDIVAEGVEVFAQSEKLYAEGVQYIQGYYFSKPLTAYETAEFIESRYNQKLEEEADNLELEVMNDINRDYLNSVVSARAKEYTIALCMSNIQEQIERKFAMEFCDMARAHGMFTQIFCTNWGISERNQNAAGQANVFKLINYDQIDAIIIFQRTINNDTVVKQLVNEAKLHNVPAICVDGETEGAYYVEYDYVTSFEKIIRHIIERHKLTKINFIAGRKGNRYSDERLEAYRRVLAEKGIEYDERRVRYGDFWEEPAARAVDEFLEDKSIGRPEAIVCANDTMAMAAINRLNELGISVPEQMVVTGFDGIEMEQYFSPRLTTAEQNATKCATQIIEMIENLMENKSVPLHVVIPHTVKISQSCGCQPKSNISAAKKLKDVVSAFRGREYFEELMYSMFAKLAISDTFDADVKIISEFVQYIGCEYFGLFLTEDFMSDVQGIQGNDVEFVKQNQNKGYSKKMYRLASGDVHEDMDYKEYVFGTKEIVPNMKECGGDRKNMIMYALYLGGDPIGYIAMSFWKNNINFKYVNSFCNDINNALIIMRNQAQIKRSNSLLLTTNSTLNDLYQKDALTMMYNRHGFEVNYKEMTESGNYTGSHILVASFDLDNLKEINDTYLHSEGDVALKAAARCVFAVAGVSGVSARFGGDEFVVAKYTDYPDSDKVKLTKLIEETLYEYNKESGKPYKVEMSFGIVTHPFEKDIDVYKLIEEADQIMYDMKQKHKEARKANKVQESDPEA